MLPRGQRRPAGVHRLPVAPRPSRYVCPLLWCRVPGESPVFHLPALRPERMLAQTVGATPTVSGGARVYNAYFQTHPKEADREQERKTEEQHGAGGGTARRSPLSLRLSSSPIRRRELALTNEAHVAASRRPCLRHSSARSSRRAGAHEGADLFLREDLYEQVGGRLRVAHQVQVVRRLEIGACWRTHGRTPSHWARAAQATPGAACLQRPIARSQSFSCGAASSRAACHDYAASSACARSAPQSPQAVSCRLPRAAAGFVTHHTGQSWPRRQSERRRPERKE